MAATLYHHYSQSRALLFSPFQHLPFRGTRPIRRRLSHFTLPFQLTDSAAVPIRSLHSKQMSNRTFPFSSAVKLAAMSGLDSLSDRNSCALASGIIETAYFSPFGITSSQTSQERTPLFSIFSFTISQATTAGSAVRIFFTATAPSPGSRPLQDDGHADRRVVGPFDISSG